MSWPAVVRACLTVVCVLVSASRAPAQLGSGSLHGLVVDARGAAVSGARVSIGGPAGEQAQITDAGGRFRFLALPPGSYSVRVTREGATPAGHPNVTVRVGRATVIQIMATPGGHHILGASESAMLDARVVATGANMRLEQLEMVPFAQDLASVLQSTPGASLDLVNVGGSTTGDRLTAVFRGAPRDANTWTVDGITLTDMTASGLAPRYFEYGLLEEVQTVTGGPDIQQMTAGLGVNLVTKRGTNLFQGQGRAYFSDGASSANDVQPGAVHFEGALDFGAEAGGAIIRDRLWYFAGLDGVSSDREVVAATDVASRDFSRTSFLGKLSFNAGRNALTGSVHTSGLGREGEGASVLRAPSAVWDDDGRTTVARIEDSAVLGANWFVTALAGLVDTGFTLSPVGTAPAHVAASGTFQDGFQRVTTDHSSKEARLSLTGYFGTHEVQAGAGYRTVSADALYEWPGNAITASSSTPVTLMILPADRDVSARATYSSAWVQDTINHGRLTANLGVRFDVQRGRNRESAAIANAFSPLVPAATFDGDDGWSWTSIVPRLGLTYALGPDRTMLVRAAFSRYPDQLGLDRVLLLNPIAPVGGRELDGSETFAFFDANGNRQADAGETRTGSTILGFATSDPRFLFQPSLVTDDFDPPMTSELLLGVDRLIGRGALSAHLQWRTRSGISDDAPLVVSAPGGSPRPVAFADFGLGPLVTVPDLDGTPIVLETFDLNSPWSYTGGFLMTNGGREQRAMNLTLQYDQRYVRGAYVRMWINFGRSEWTVPETFFVDRNDLLGADDNDGAPVADQSASPARRGVFLNNNWSYELLGMTRAPYGLEFALRAYGRQGYPAPVFATVDAIDATRMIQVATIDRDRFGRLFIADLRVSRVFAVAKFNLDVSAELFNLFNSQRRLQHEGDLISAARGSTIETLTPRVIRFGVRVRF